MKEQLNLDDVTIYTKDDVIDAMGLIGQEVYMSDDEDFYSYCKCTFIGINYKIDDSYTMSHPFVTKDENQLYCEYRYFILASDAKFKKGLRPFKDIEEFRHTLGVKVGNIIHYREKGSSLEYNLMWTGYTNDELIVIFGGTFHSLNNLFERYEYCDSEGKWHPFGVEE